MVLAKLSAKLSTFFFCAVDPRIAYDRSEPWLSLRTLAKAENCRRQQGIDDGSHDRAASAKRGFSLRRSPRFDGWLQHLQVPEDQTTDV